MDESTEGITIEYVLDYFYSQSCITTRAWILIDSNCIYLRHDDAVIRMVSSLFYNFSQLLVKFLIVIFA